MNIKEMAKRINDLSLSKKDRFSNLQYIRTANRKIKSSSNYPFASSGIKDRYAFHSGGRTELQFNYGEDEINGKSIFRYGVAFSLWEDKSVRDFKKTFQSQITRFNDYLRKNPQYLDNFVMWYDKKNVGLQEYFKRVVPINDNIFRSGHFIFIGKYYQKKISEIKEDDIREIENTFDYLMPLYEEIQFGIKKEEKRIARLCWNLNGWVMPSGREGKSLDANSHEAQYGFGHEEWLFDTSKVIDGYHYGFMEPIRKQQNAYENRTYDVWLYSIDNDSKQRYWIGEIESLEVLDKKTADRIKKIYIERGWLEEMKGQLHSVNANMGNLSTGEGINIFNVRYKLKYLFVNDPYFKLPKSHPVYKQSRYAFIFFNEEFNAESLEEDNYLADAKVDTIDDDIDVEKKTYLRQPKSIEIQNIHKVICQRLAKHLKKKYGEKQIDCEHKAGFGSARIDIFQKNRGEITFYEVKTYNSLRTSIRDAFGQLIEYSLWPNKKKADKLIIVTQPHGEKEIEKAKIYFKHLRDNYNIPIYYQYYDYENDVLGEID